MKRVLGCHSFHSSRPVGGQRRVLGRWFLRRRRRISQQPRWEGERVKEWKKAAQVCSPLKLGFPTFKNYKITQSRTQLIHNYGNGPDTRVGVVSERSRPCRVSSAWTRLVSGVSMHHRTIEHMIMRIIALSSSRSSQLKQEHVWISDLAPAW